MGDLIVGGIVLLLFGGAALALYQGRKKSGCAGCSGCAHACDCKERQDGGQKSE